MTVRKLWFFATVLTRHVTGRYALRAVLVLVVALVGLSIGIRVRSYLLTRRIQAVLTGLQQLKIGTTKEEDLPRTVPYLVRQPFERHEGAHRIRFYVAELSNEHEYDHWQERVPRFVIRLWPPKRWGDDGFTPNKWRVMDGSRKAAYLMGWRYLSFSAGVTVVDGRVSRVSYGIEPDVFMGWPKGYLVTATSTHGFRMARHSPLALSSADEENPYYRFGALAGEFSWFNGDDATIGVAYTPDAPRERVSHIYQVDLSCFWSFRGCHSVRQVVPLLWKDRQEILPATARRLTSSEPCPERVLAGRVRTLPDLNVALLEVVRARGVGGEGSSEVVADYRLREVILGHPEGPWSGLRGKRAIEGQLPRAGERYLLFTGATFDSCRIVPATPSTEAAVRGAVPAGRLRDDEVLEVGGGRM